MPARKKTALESLSPEGMDFTINELEKIEKIVDVPASKWEDAPQFPMMKAMIWVLLSRTNPDLTLEEAGNIPQSKLEEVLAPFVVNGTEAT